MLQLVSPMCNTIKTQGLPAAALSRISKITRTQYIWSRLNLHVLHFVSVLRYYCQLGCVHWVKINHSWKFHHARWTGFKYTLHSRVSTIYDWIRFVCSKSGSKNTRNTARISTVKTRTARPTVYKHVLWNGLVCCDASHSDERCTSKGKGKVLLHL